MISFPGLLVLIAFIEKVPNLGQHHKPMCETAGNPDLTSTILGQPNGHVTRKARAPRPDINGNIQNSPTQYTE